MDITERLNNWAQHATTGQKLVIIDAKNEIERLREALKRIAERKTPEDEECADIIARFALRQKDSE